jgi:hypothetical protein
MIYGHFFSTKVVNAARISIDVVTSLLQTPSSSDSTGSSFCVDYELNLKVALANRSLLVRCRMNEALETNAKVLPHN